MAISIKSKGKATAKPKRSTSTKSKTSARSTKAATTRKAAPKSTKSSTSTKAKATTRRSPKTDMSQRELDRILKPLGKSAEKRDKLNAQWKEAVSETNEMILAALDAGVPMSLVVERASISRQHCYKLIEDAKAGKRSNGTGSKTRAKSAAKTATKATTSKRKTGSAKKTGTTKRTTAKRKPRTKAKA